MSPRVVVVGPPGAGKTTVGGLLAQRLGVDFRDADHDIETAAGKTISDIFTSDGEPAFRKLEEQAVATALGEHPGVLALGGGAILSERTRELLRAHVVLFLNVGMSAGIERTGLATNRPLLSGVNPRSTFKILLDARLPLYREVASVEIMTDELKPEQVVDAAIEALSAIDAAVDAAPAKP